MDEWTKKWVRASIGSLPVVLEDTTDVYNAVHAEATSATYSAATTVAATIATCRTAWVFIGRTNQILPPSHRVLLRDNERAIDRVDEMFAALNTIAQRYNCVVWNNGWTVWAGKKDVIDDLKKRIGFGV